uniref:Uncharacterized protein n=1 Tax=Oryza punctata TaxID=4537 RepID=A0A0E0LPR4_ORYPU
MSAGSLLHALDIMFTVVNIGLVVIKGTSAVPRDRNIHVFNVLVAFWALGLIAPKMLNLCYQRTGHPEKMFSPTAIYLIEIVLTLTMLWILLFLDERKKKKEERRHPASLQDVLWMVIEGASPSAPFFLVGLAITGYGMVMFFSGGSPSVFFLGDFGVYFIIIGLIVIIARRECARAQHDYEGLRAGSSLIVYILVLLVATAITGKIDPRINHCNQYV